MRGGVQAVCLGAFVYLALAARFGWPTPLAYDGFLRLDPLLWLLSSVAAREPARYAWVALGLVVVTATFGRKFCGWACPLGAAIDGLGRLRGRRPGIALAFQVLRARFWILMVLLGAAALGANYAGWLDPLAMSSRALHVARGASQQPAGAAICWALVAAAAGLALLAPRLWCRALCPLGALLSLLARLAPYRRRTAEGCAQCGACSAVCPMGNTPAENSPDRCIGCRRCQAACGEGAIAFGFGRRSIPAGQSVCGVGPDGLSRRGWLASLAAGAAAGVLLRPRSAYAPLRPPGAAPEQDFAARCVGCGTCLAVCPTGGLSLLARPDRLDALFTPQLVPRAGGCLRACTACGHACPTGAIARIAAEDKPRIQMGLAVIDRARCLPWARDERCLICRDACPRDYDAIELRSMRPRAPHPYVRDRQCTGCALCEHACPEAAIRVVAVHAAPRATGLPLPWHGSRSCQRNEHD